MCIVSGGPEWATLVTSSWTELRRHQNRTWKCGLRQLYTNIFTLFLASLTLHWRNSSAEWPEEKSKSALRVGPVRAPTWSQTSHNLENWSNGMRQNSYGSLCTFDPQQLGSPLCILGYYWGSTSYFLHLSILRISSIYFFTRAMKATMKTKHQHPNFWAEVGLMWKWGKCAIPQLTTRGCLQIGVYLNRLCSKNKRIYSLFGLGLVWLFSLYFPIYLALLLLSYCVNWT